MRVLLVPMLLPLLGLYLLLLRVSARKGRPLHAFGVGIRSRPLPPPLFLRQQR